MQKAKKKKKKTKPRASRGICPRVPSLTHHKKTRFEGLASPSPLLSLSCSNTRPALKGKQSVCPGLLFYLWINWSHLWIVCVLPSRFLLFFSFFFRTPDQALTSGGVGPKVEEGEGSRPRVPGPRGALVLPGMNPPQLAAYKIPRWHPADGISCFPVSAPGRTIISQRGVSLRC